MISPMMKRSMMPAPALAAVWAAATLLCGRALADAPIDGSAKFFDHFCGECHYEDQSGGLDLSVLSFDPNNRDNFAT